MSDALSQPPASLAGLAVYTLFRGDRTQLLQWCNFHLTAGAERLYVVLDSPPPGFADSLPQHPRIDWQVVDQPTWDALYPAGSANVERKQQDSFRWTARRALADGHDHLAFIDADELLFLARPFRDLVAAHPEASALTVRVREMWFEEGAAPSGPFSATLGLRSSSIRAINWSAALGWRAQYLRNGLLGHTGGKSIYRLPLVSGAIGLHFPLGAALAASAQTIPAGDGALLHFDAGDLSIWNEKWGLRLQGQTRAVKLAAQRLAQEQLFARALRQPPEGQQAFFEEFFSLDADTQARLEDKGVLTRIQVGAELAGPFAVETGATGARELRRLPPIADRVDFQFALVCDQRFVKPTFATMTSVLSHMGELGSVRFVVLGDGLQAADVIRLKALEATRYDVAVIVHDITSDLDRDVGTEDQKRATFGRIYFVDYLPEQRTVYLDGDVLATRPFPELFDTDLGTAALAGVSDSSALRLEADPSVVPLPQRNRLMGITDGNPTEYLNGGVLIFDMDNPDFRELALRARALVVLEGNTLQQRDQDALNLAFAGRKHRLPSTYNYMTQFYASDRVLHGDLIRRKYDNADAALIHFSGKVKPWLEPTDEFYNGLYRRLVSTAEAAVGVSCDFYFSRPSTTASRDWPAERWVEVLTTPPERLLLAPPTREDIAVVDICDEQVYLTLSTEMYELAHRTGLRLTAVSHWRTLFDLPLADVSAPLMHLSERVVPGVRRLPLDLPQALAADHGIARNVELMVVDQGRAGGVTRSLGVLDVLASGSGATAGLLADVGMDGALESLAGGWLTGWLHPHSPNGDEAVCLYLDGELAARRTWDAVPALARTVTGPRPFKFFAANLVRLGYGRGGRISVRLAGTHIPLPGGDLPVDDVNRSLRYDSRLGVWVKAGGRPLDSLRPVARGLRTRLQRAVSASRSRGSA